MLVRCNQIVFLRKQLFPVVLSRNIVSLLPKTRPEFVVKHPLPPQQPVRAERVDQRVLPASSRIPLARLLRAPRRRGVCIVVHVAGRAIAVSAHRRRAPVERRRFLHATITRRRVRPHRSRSIVLLLPQ